MHTWVKMFVCVVEYYSAIKNEILSFGAKWMEPKVIVVKQARNRKKNAVCSHSCGSFKRCLVIARDKEGRLGNGHQKYRITSSGVTQHSGMTAAHRQVFFSVWKAGREELIGTKHGEKTRKCRLCSWPGLNTLCCIHVLKYSTVLRKAVQIMRVNQNSFLKRKEGTTLYRIEMERKAILAPTFQSENIRYFLWTWLIVGSIYLKPFFGLRKSVLWPLKLSYWEAIFLASSLEKNLSTSTTARTWHKVPVWHMLWRFTRKYTANTKMFYMGCFIQFERKLVISESCISRRQIILIYKHNEIRSLKRTGPRWFCLLVSPI